MSIDQGGVVSHSSPDVVYIFSTELATNSKDKNFTARRGASTFLQVCGISFKDVKGYYKGNQEDSFVVVGNREKVYQLAKAYRQETVLELWPHRHGTRKAYLVPADYKDSAPAINHFIGYFQSVPKDVALMQDGYTYDPSTKTYYAVMPTDNRQFNRPKEQ